MAETLFAELKEINARPEPFEFYTAGDLWTDEYTSGRMLAYHLDENVDVSSRNMDFIRRSVAWMVSRFDISPETRIADFGCGPGLYAARLAESGAKVTGIDFSGRSIAYARKAAEERSLDIEYIHQNYLEFETKKRFDLILMIMCDYCALSPDQRREMLKKFHKFLRPHGRVLLDAYSLAAFDGREEAATYGEGLLDGFWSKNSYYGFLNTFKYEPEKVVLDKYTIVEADRMRTLYNWLQYFSPKALEQEFARARFSIEGFYADVAGTPHHGDASEFAVVARKS
jgi:SAM-dependent methyltransferase